MTESGAGLLAALLLFATPAPVRADAKSEAAAELERAQDHLDRGEYDQAIARFRHAHELQPESSGPLFGLGLALQRADRCAEAIPTLEEYLRKKKQPRPEAVAALEECRKKAPPPSGHVVVSSVPSGAEVRFDDPNGPVAGVTPLESDAVPDGAHRVFLSKGGFLTGVGELTIASGTTARVQLTLEPVAAPPPPKPVEPPPPPKPVAPPIVPGRLIVEVAPVAATVRVNGLSVAQDTRRYEGPLAVGSYTVDVDHDGYRAAATTVEITAGKTESKKATLKPLRRSAWLGLAVPFTAVALGTGIGALVTFYAADGHAPGPDFDTNKTANAALQGVFYPSLALAAAGYLLYGLLNRGRIPDGPALRF